MKARTCFVQVWISNDKAEKACYSLRPMSPDELGQAAAGFKLTKLNCTPPSVYAVYVRAEGVVVCSCRQFHTNLKCKHADALVASGVLPCNLLSLLQSRTQLLDRLEEDAKRHQSSVANLLASVSNLTERCACLQQMVDEAQDEIVRLDKPKARRRAKAA